MIGTQVTRSAIRRNLHGIPLDDLAIRCIRELEPSAVQMNAEGYWVAYSGGKDSTVVLDLFRRSGCKGMVHHNLTTADPPELVRFIRSVPGVIVHRPDLTMWELIRARGCPPLRNRRFCCEILKEGSGPGHVVMTGIRADESNRRRGRQMVEPCLRDGTRRLFHPIIAWTTGDVWAYIRQRSLPYCSLYDEGFKRLGCVMCPNGGAEGMARDAARWPRIAEAYRRAILATWRPGPGRFDSPEELWQWWKSGGPRCDKAMPLFAVAEEVER